MNTKQKKLLVAYFFANCMGAIFFPSIIFLVAVSCVTLFGYFKYKD